MTTITTYRTRSELIELLRERDGDECTFPEHSHTLDFEATEGPKLVTIDHREPQSWCRAQGWTNEQIWGLSNLSLMCKSGNASKGHRRYREDGTLEPKPLSRLRYRRHKRAERPEVCTSCSAGRDLGPDEVCASCGSGPLPDRWPRWAKVPANECLHDGVFWCWVCASGIIEMRGATETILIGGEGGEDAD